MLRAVDEVLTEIGVDATPRLLVLNKVDLIDAARREDLELRFPDAVTVSAQTGEGLDALADRIEKAFLNAMRPVELLVPYREGSRLAELHELAGDLDRRDTPDGVRVSARLPSTVAARYERFAVNGRR
jgi:GTP-binding protein HflX